MCRFDANGRPHLLGFSDCIMMTILSYLDSTSLYNISQTCTYFRNIVLDKNLWKYMDCRDDPNTDDKVNYCCDRFNEKTTHALFRAHSKKIGIIPKSCFKKIEDYETLSVLCLENQKFSGEHVSMMTFPKNLEELSLRKVHVKHGERFFQYSKVRMKKLRVLIVDGCNWIDSSFLMSISKYANLEILSMVKCSKLHHTVNPYLSIARHGFKKLKILDARFNTISNDFLREFSTKNGIMALYFQSMRSHQIDTGVPLMRNMASNLNADELELMNRNIISNRTLQNYKYVLGDQAEAFPKSLLYTDPYPPCSCKFTGFHEDLPEEKLENLMKVDDFLDFHYNAPQRFICKRHISEVHKLPVEFRDFFMQNQRLFQAGDSSDESSDEEPYNCCMYGMGRAQQMIVLKVKNVFNQPQAEVYDFAPARAPNSPERNVPEQQLITVDLFGQNNQEGNENGVNGGNENEPKPSTSREDQPSCSGSGTEKRKQEESDEGSNKKMRIDIDVCIPSTSSCVMMPSAASNCSENKSDSALSPQPSTSQEKTETSDNKRKSDDGEHSSEKKGKKKSKLKEDDSINRPERDQPPPKKSPSLTDYEKKMLQDIPHIKTIQRLIEPSACIEASFYNYNGKKCIDRVYSQETLKAALQEKAKAGASNSQVPEGPQPSTSGTNPREKDNTEQNNDEKPSTSTENAPENEENKNEQPPEAPPERAPRFVHQQVEELQRNLREIEDLLMINNDDYYDDQDLEVEEQRFLFKKLKLRRLSLRGYRKITDKALKHLRHLNLELLDLTHTNVSLRGIRTFISYNPDCRIIHKNFCVCKPKLLV